MSFKPASLIGGLAAVAVLSGCVGPYKSNFPIVVENRAPNAIQVLANGNGIGQVAAGQTGSFSLQLPESNTNVFTNGVAPTPQAQVTLTAKDLKSGTLSADKSVTLSQASPTYITFSTADFPTTVPTVARITVSPTNPTINQDIIFNASTSTGSNLTYAWDFGDGQTGTGVVVTHQYSRAGTVRIVLTVTNDSGQSNSTSNTVTVSPTVPQGAVNFTFSPTSPAINQDVLFMVSGGGGLTGATFTWDFGDGGSGSGTTITHRYSRASTFTVTLRVTSNLGQPATVPRTITVSATPAGTVNFTFSPTTPGVNDIVSFNAATTTVANATFQWDFGDGTRGSGVSVTHRYSQAGTYSITLTATNDLGQSLSTSKSLTVSGTSTTVVANFTFSPTTPNAGDTVFFNAASSTVTNGTFAWDFGDGTAGSGVAATHQYSRANTYTVTLTVTNGLGQSNLTSKTIAVAAMTLTATFTFSPTNPSISGGTNNVIFDATGSSAAATSYTWDFGDGSAAGSGQRTTHAFSLAGTWVVRLTIRDASGLTATTTNQVTVSK